MAVNKKGSRDATATETSRKGGKSQSAGNPAGFKTSSGPRSVLMRPQVRTYDSGYGYTFLDRGNAPSNLDRVLSLVRVLHFDAKGYHLIASGTVETNGTHDRVNTFWTNLYGELVYHASKVAGYNHSPKSLTDSRVPRLFIENYVACLINTRTLLAMQLHGAYSPATSSYQTVISTAGIVRRAQKSLTRLANIPVPDYYRQLSYSYAPFVGWEGGPIVLTFMTHDLVVGSHASAKAYTQASTILPNDSTDLGQVMTDVENSLDWLEYVIGTEKDDVRDFSLLLGQLLNSGVIPLTLGAVEAEPLTLNAHMYGDIFHEAFLSHDIGGTPDDLAAAPETANDEILVGRSGMGSPTPYTFAGMNAIVSVKDTNAAADGDNVLFGAFRDGHLVNSMAVGTSFVFVMYTQEDGWTIVDSSTDPDVAGTLQAFLEEGVWMHMKHASILSVISDATADRHVGLKPRDYNFSHTLGEMGDILLAAVSQAWGIPAFR